MAEEIDVPSVECMNHVFSLKRARSKAEVVDKHQVGKKLISSDYFALQKICDDYGDEDTSMEDTNPIDRGAVDPIPPPVP